MDNKEFYKKTEEFANKIIMLAKENGLTVRELRHAADTVKEIAYNSMVDSECMGKVDYQSRHIVCSCDEKGLFSD